MVASIVWRKSTMLMVATANASQIAFARAQDLCGLVKDSIVLLVQCHVVVALVKEWTGFGLVGAAWTVHGGWYRDLRLVRTVFEW